MPLDRPLRSFFCPPFRHVQTVEPGRLLAIDRCCRNDQVAGGAKVKCGEGQASGHYCTVQEVTLA